MRADLHGDARAGMLLGKPAQRLAVVGDRAFVDDVPVPVEHADGVFLVAEVETDGDEWNFGFHGRADFITALKRHSLPSHLI